MKEHCAEGRTDVLTEITSGPLNQRKVGQEHHLWLEHGPGNSGE